MKFYPVLFLSLALLGCSKNHESTEKYDASNEAVVAASEAVAAAMEATTAASEVTELASIESDDMWEYETSNDEMRGIEKQYAYIRSTNKVEFDFPYEGGSNLRITLRRDVGKSTDIMFTISKGQFTCNTFSGDCYASVKIDDNAVEEIQLVGTSDHSSEVLFIESEQDSIKFIQQLLKANKIIVELPFYQEGRQQFKFDVAGLKWNL